MTLKVYEYKNCGTCKKALKFLDAHGIAYKKLAIRDTPPTITEIKKMLGHMQDMKKLFNTSGQDYRKLNMKEVLPTLTQQEALKLLAGNGNLIKRPFIISKEIGTVGFKEDHWKELFA